MLHFLDRGHVVVLLREGDELLDVALDFGDTYTICEAKYFKKPIELDDIHREAGQIRGIKSIDVAQIGFISASGFAQKEDGYLYYTGDDLYAD